MNNINDFECPHCGRQYDISEDDLYDCFEEEGRITEIGCDECGKTFYVRQHISYSYYVSDKFEDF